MRRKQAKLWRFGGGVDPVVLENEDEKNEVLSKEAVRVASSGLVIRLKPQVVKRLDPRLLETGEEQRRLRLRPQRADWVDAMYIRGEPTDGNRISDYVVGGSEEYPALRIPSRWLQNETVQGWHNPFHDVAPGDPIDIRVLPEGVIEIYTQEVFDAHPRFSLLRALAPFTTLFSGKSKKAITFNRAAINRYGGQIFEIVPINIDRLENACRNQISDDLYTDNQSLPTPDEFQHVLAEEDIEPISNAHMSIAWKPDSEKRQNVQALEKEDTGRFRVKLPARGKYHLKGGLHLHLDDHLLIHRSSEQSITDSAWDNGRPTVSSETKQFNRKYFARINGYWWGRFFEVPKNGPPIIYIPQAKMIT